ncbi:hypothetical protein AaE_009466 [Aphanomyces astaci]|uniref:Uncharacterized protein n=1 Tax=Aphanomyces astaci TaxID=112090 RepID=A0A6A5A4Y2_APHAT|nr:hypothetical protein AaE_009466 [Aphanomyces astaci]
MPRTMKAAPPTDSDSSHARENYFDNSPSVQEAPFKSVQSPAAAAVVTTSALSSQPSFRGEKIRLDLSLQWANNFGIQLAMFLYFVGALAVTIVIPSLGYKVEVGLLAGGSVTILSTAAVLYTYSVMPTWKKHPNPLIFYRSLFDMGFVLVLMTTQLYKYVNPVSPCHHMLQQPMRRNLVQRRDRRLDHHDLVRERMQYRGRVHAVLPPRF